MFTEERDRWDVLIGVIVVALVAGGVYVIKSHAPVATPPPIAAAAPSRETSPIAMDHGSVERAAQSPIAVAYECWRDGHRILSDEPCGSDASIRAIAEPNRMDAQDTTQLYRRPAHTTSSSRRVSYGTSSSFSESSECAAIEREIDAINARMRQRYRSPEGERFRARLRDLSRARYEAKCIR